MQRSRTPAVAPKSNERTTIPGKMTKYATTSAAPGTSPPASLLLFPDVSKKRIRGTSSRIIAHRMKVLNPVKLPNTAAQPWESLSRIGPVTPPIRKASRGGSRTVAHSKARYEQFGLPVAVSTAIIRSAMAAIGATRIAALPPNQIPEKIRGCFCAKKFNQVSIFTPC